MASPVPVNDLVDGVAHAPLPRGKDDDDDDPTVSEEDGSVDDSDDAHAVDTNKGNKKPKAKQNHGKGKAGRPKGSKNKTPQKPKAPGEPKKRLNFI